MAALSEDLKMRVVTSYLNGEGSYVVLAQRYKVHRDSVRNWVVQYRKVGHLKPSDAKRGPQPKIRHYILRSLKSLVKKYPDATLEEYSEMLEEATGVSVHPSTISRVLSKHQLTVKKNTICE